MLDLTFEPPKIKTIAGAKYDWELVIGMEVHAQIASKAKLKKRSSYLFASSIHNVHAAHRLFFAGRLRPLPHPPPP